ncbi:MAG: hypothetical protein ACE5EE_01850 [Fidelibacterota bacterium]
MKRLIQFLFLLPLAGLFAQTVPLFDIDLRIRVVEDNLLYVVVQIDNRSGRTVSEIEGFITEVDPSLHIVSEKKVTHLHSYEAPFGPGQTIIRGLTYPYEKTQDYRYRYHISKIRFTKDSNIYMYSPVIGLVRIE